ncbi:MAG: META domain-containing protein [Methylobacterium sp.]|nr:META domain-containing protein [Methylobacterium sp.]
MSNPFPSRAALAGFVHKRAVFWAAFVAGWGLALANAPVQAQPQGTLPEAWRALGHEPSWVLSRNGDAMLLETNFGADRLRFAIPEAVSIDSGQVRYAATVNGKSLILTVKTAICVDSMSGMPRPQQVTILLDGQRLTGCGGEPGSLLQGRDWIVTRLGDRPVLPTPKITMTFGKDSTVSGLGSCNRFNAGFQLTGEGMTISKGLSTMMACEPPLMDQERVFLDLLERVSRFSFTPEGRLVLHTNSGQAILAE